MNHWRRRENVECTCKEQYILMCWRMTCMYWCVDVWHVCIDVCVECVDVLYCLSVWCAWVHSVLCQWVTACHSASTLNDVSLTWHITLCVCVHQRVKHHSLTHWVAELLSHCVTESLCHCVIVSLCLLSAVNHLIVFVWRVHNVSVLVITWLSCNKAQCSQVCHVTECVRVFVCVCLCVCVFVCLCVCVFSALCSQNEY